MSEKLSATSRVLRDIGEEAWLKRLARMLAVDDSRTVGGFGDDAACLALEGECDRLLLLTTDLLVEATHFTWKTATPASLGEKAVAVNVSDVAAMGGRPTALVAALAAPADFPVNRLETICRAMQRACRRWRIAFVGGDTVRSDRLLVAVTLLGEFDGPAERLPFRNRLCKGQRLYVTGTLGDSAGGLALLLGTAPTIARRARSKKVMAWRKRLIDRHRRPRPRLEEGRVLAHGLDDLAMIDLSDDLCKSINLLAEASGTGVVVRLDGLPISLALRSYCRKSGRDPLELAVRGGEDFELLFATSAAPGTVKGILRSAGLATRVSEIGRVGGRRVHWLDSRGRPTKLPWKPYEHFA